jgi:hypothetical protein
MSREKKGRQRDAASQLAIHPIESEFSALAGLAIGDLRMAWTNRIGNDPPAIRSRALFLRMLAWKIQEDAFGGLDADTRRALDRIAAALERDGSYEPKIRHDISSGVVLTREWKGVVHKVTVTAAGFQHLGKRYKSLSDIARTITGTRWSGPRFFGLEQKPARPSRRAAT